MAGPGYMYVIPPYLLDTWLGQELYRDLLFLDPELAARNIFSPQTSNYRFRSPKDLVQDPHSFCDNSYVNELIRARLKEKFSVLGLLGDTPPDQVANEYLFELYVIFKDRLLPGNDEAETFSNENLETTRRTGENHSPIPRVSSIPLSSVTVEPHAPAKGSLFNQPRYGEFIYKDENGKSKSKFENESLHALITWARKRKEHKYHFFPYLMVDNKNLFLSPLPMYWTPITGEHHLTILDEQYGLSTEIENGFSVIRLDPVPRNAVPEESGAPKKRFHNFIANNEVKENTGIFYFELSIEQTATRASDFEPLIHANDPSLSSASSIFFNMGFTKRNINFDKVTSSSGSSSAATSAIDLKDIQGKLRSYKSNLTNNKLDEDTVTLLGAEPGVSFEGSLAISFNNTCSYASIKKNDGNFRASSLNLNRRFSHMNRHIPGEQETSKLDIDTPFQSHLVSESEESKVFRTDNVGFGVNFIERSFFITLNGVLVKTILEQDLKSTNIHQDSIFGSGPESGPLFPIIGFRLAGFSKPTVSKDLPHSRIITNFGLKNFQFNVNGYLKRLKVQQKKLLQSVVADEIQNSASANSEGLDVTKFERAIRNVQNDPTVLNEMIEGYLIQEGFLETLSSFEGDLRDLSRSIRQTHDGSTDAGENALNSADVHTQSMAAQRQLLKSYILKGQFSEAIRVLHRYFSKLKQFERFVFELELSQYIELLHNFLQVKFRSQSSQTSNVVDDLFQQAFNLGRSLIEKAKGNAGIALKELSGVLLLNREEDLKNLSLASRILERHPHDVKVLANVINSEILEEHDFSKESRLENMVACVGENVKMLSSENKNPFRMVNFDKDYLNF